MGRALSHVLRVFRAATPADGGDAAAVPGADCLLVRLALVVRAAGTLAEFRHLWDETLQELHMRWVSASTVQSRRE
jgi:hypothetical protein